MDDEDLQEILEHLEVTDTNNHNLIETVNKQIYINTRFNESIQTLKLAIEEDRENIKNTIKELKNRHNEIVRRLLYSDQMFKLTYLKNKTEHIKDNVASAGHHIVHPSILSSEEIDRFEIDFFKLKLMKIDMLNYKHGLLTIAIKIPNNYIETDLKIIVPLPNKYYMEILETNRYVIEIQNKVFNYEENVYLKNLKLSKHCTISNNCKIHYNNKTQVEEFEDDMLFIKNADNLQITHNCDNRKISLSKNYLLTFYNCEIKIRNKTFQNHKTIVQDKYFYPNKNPTNNLTATFKKKNDFEKIVIKNFDNIKQINELKFHQNISYGINISLIVIVIIAVVLFTYFIKRQNEVKIVNTVNPRDIEMEKIKEKYRVK